MKRILCANRRCGWKGTDEDVLKAPNPFEEGEEMWACPECRDYDSLVTPCDFEGCWNESTCGTNTDEGYKRLCGNHFRKEIDGRKAT